MRGRAGGRARGREAGNQSRIPRNELLNQANVAVITVPPTAFTPGGGRPGRAQGRPAPDRPEMSRHNLRRKSEGLKGQAARLYAESFICAEEHRQLRGRVIKPQWIRNYQTKIHDFTGLMLAAMSVSLQIPFSAIPSSV